MCLNPSCNNPYTRIRAWRSPVWRHAASSGRKPAVLFRALLLFFLFICPLAAKASAAEPAPGTVVLEQGSTQVPLTQYARIVRDDGARLSADNLLGGRAAGIAPDGREFISMGFTRAAHWLYIPLRNDTNAPLQRLLVFEPTWLEDVMVVLYQEHHRVQTYHLGALQPFADRSLAQPLINQEISVPPGDSVLMVRVQSRDPVDISLTLWGRGAYYEAQSNESIFWGVTYGILAAMLLYNLFLYVSVRDSTYVAYAAYLLMFLGVNATLNGHAYQYFWPGSPELNKWMLTTLVYAFMLSGIYFGCRFLDLRSRLPRAYRLALGGGGMLAISYVLTALMGGYRWSIVSATLWVIVYAPFVVLLGLWSLRKGNRAARFFLIGTVSGFVGSCITACTTAGLLSFTFWTYRAVDFGMLVDAILLSFALADRIALMREEKELAQSRLQANDERWRLALESAGEGVWDWDVPSGDVQYSRHWKEMLGYSEGELANNFDTWRSLVHPDDLGAALARIDVLTRGDTNAYRSEFRMRCKDGVWKWMLAQGAVVERDAAGVPLRIIGTHIDISDARQQAEALRDLNEHLETRVRLRTLDLEQANQAAEAASASKSRFLAAAGHDLRQPLAAANLFLSALQATPTSSEQAALLGRMEQALSNFNGLLDSLLNISRLDAGVLRPDLTHIRVGEIFRWVEASFAPLAEERGVEFRMRHPLRAGLCLYADNALVRSVMINLVSNAIKYSPAGRILIGARVRGKKLLFQIWDTGMGIPHDDVERIFEEFYQVSNPQRDRERGLGLGLSIVRRALRLLGETITCRSQPGKGSVFQFSLPLAQGEEELVQPVSAGATVPADFGYIRGKRILVVEDDWLVAEGLVSALRAAGAEVSLHHQAHDALNDPASREADVVISDYMLSGGMNGVSFLNALKLNATRPFRALLVTGDTSPALYQQLAECPWPVLHKPVSLAELIRHLGSR